MNENIDFREFDINHEEDDGYYEGKMDSDNVFPNERSSDIEDEIDTEDLKLGFVRLIGTETGGLNIYELIFTYFIDEFWGEGFNYQPAALCNNLEPEQKYISRIYKIKTAIKLNTIGECGCFSMQDCMDGVVSLAYESLLGLDAYPEEGRLVLQFGDSYEEVREMLAKKRILL